MIQTAVAAFVGCFAALVVMAEVTIANKWLKYLLAFIAGVIVTVVLAFFLAWVAGIFAHVSTN